MAKYFKPKIIKMKKLLFLAIAGTLFTSCSSVEPNYEGVLMENYGRNGKSDFSVVSGKQWTLSPGTTLYQAPMFETSGDPEAVFITTKDASAFTVDPSYQYQAIRGRGIDIVFSYKHLGVSEPEVMLDNIEGSILNKLVTNAYREEARSYTTDSLMNNMRAFESQVELRLKNEFQNKYFKLNNLTSGLTPPKSMTKMIEARNNAIQEANTVRNELETSKIRLEKARIDAEANRVRAAGLDSKILQEKWIEAVRNSRNTKIITDGKTPIIIQ